MGPRRAPVASARAPWSDSWCPARWSATRAERAHRKSPVSIYDTRLRACDERVRGPRMLARGCSGQWRELVSVHGHAAHLDAIGSNMKLAMHPGGWLQQAAPLARRRYQHQVDDWYRRASATAVRAATENREASPPRSAERPRPCRGGERLVRKGRHKNIGAKITCGLPKAASFL